MTPMCAMGAAILLLTGSLLEVPQGQDTCLAAVPPSLRAAVELAFPKYRLPRRSDNSQQDIDYYKQQGGLDCLGVTQGDFNGDGHKDYGVLLTSLDGNRGVLVAALPAADQWHLQTLRKFSKAERVNLYVTTAAPGEYKQPEGLDQQLEPGEVKSFRSDRQGIVTGTTESSAVCYFWTPQGWVHVWLMD